MQTQLGESINESAYVIAIREPSSVLLERGRGQL